jgi:WD40 repeat protein
MALLATMVVPFEQAPGQDITRLVGQPIASKLLAAGDRDSVTLWDTATGEERASLSGHLRDVEDLAFSPDGTRLASTGWSLKLWDLRAVLQPWADEGHFYEVTAVAYSPDGMTLASKLWSVPAWKEITFYKSASDGFTSVAFSPDGRTLAAGHRDTSIVVWDLKRTLR